MSGGDRRTIATSLPVTLVERLDTEARARLVGRNLLIEMMLTQGVERLQPPAIFDDPASTEGADDGR